MNYRRIKNIRKFEVRKRTLKSRPDESDTLNKNNRRSTLTNHQLEKCCVSASFTVGINNKSSKFFNESNQFQNKATTLTPQNKIILSAKCENCYFIP